MSATFDLIIKNGTVVNHDGTGQRDIGIRDGRFAALGELSANAAGEVIDASGLHVLPGVIDTQVHFREPGMENKETLQTGSEAAVLGGVSAVFEMPNTKPLTTTAQTLASKVARGREVMACDFAFYVGATRENVDDLAALERQEGAAGTKVFLGSSTGDLLVDDEATLARILGVIRRRAAFHSEDEARLNARKGERRENDPTSHPVWRDEIAALQSTERLVRLAEAARQRIHVLHISCAEEMAFLADHRDFASVEVTPHHLTMAAPECYERLGTLAQMNPPVRDAHHQAALWAALNAGIVDVLGSDHAPHTREETSLPYPQSPSGATGVQTLVPLMLDHVNAGKLSLARFVDLTSHGPARLFSIAGKGRIAVGYDADLSIVDLKAQRTITNAWIASRSDWTPCDGKDVTGWPVGTVIRGRRVMWDGEIVCPRGGEPARFME